MKKFLVAIIAIFACLCLAGCGSSWTSSIDPSTLVETEAVSSNGGFLVEKGSYIYFINGSEDSTAENSFGTPLKGALVRMKKADIGKDGATIETVIPKLFYSGYMAEDSGLFIFGNYVYFTSPCSSKDKEGVVRNTEIEYIRAKLDGSETKVIATRTSATDVYRYVQIDGVVYLALSTTNDNGESVIRIYNADTQTFVRDSRVVKGYKFSTDLTSPYVYYTSLVHNEKTNQDESYNAVYKMKLDGSDGNDEDGAGVQILVGAGKYDDETNGIGIAGVTFEVVAYNGKQLFVKETDIITEDIVKYYGINEADLDLTSEGNTAKNYKALKCLSKNANTVSAVFNKSSIFIDLDNIVYFDSSLGIMKYSYTQAENQTNGREKIYLCEDMLSATIKFVKDGYVYVTDTSDEWYRLNLAEVVDLSTGEIKNGEPELKKLNHGFTPNSSWFLPEVVDNYIIFNISGSIYSRYNIAVDMTKVEAMTSEELADYSEENRENILANMKLLVGVMTEDDFTAYEEYLNENYPADEEEASSSN